MNVAFWRSRGQIDAHIVCDFIHEKDEYNEYVKRILSLNTPPLVGVFGMFENEEAKAVVLPLFVEMKDFDAMSYERYAKIMAESARQNYSAVGAAISCEKGLSFEKIGDCEIFYRQVAKIINDCGFDFIHIVNVSDVEAARIAVLAVKEAFFGDVTLTFATDDDELIANWEALAVATLFEGIGVSALGFAAYENLDFVEEIMARLSQYVEMPLFVTLDAVCREDCLSEGVVSPRLYSERARALLLAGADFIILGCGANEEYCELVDIVLKDIDDKKRLEAEEREIIATCVREAHFLDAFADISPKVYISADFAKDVLIQEDEGFAAIKVHFSEESDFELFHEDMYMLTTPICISAENIDLFEKAARLHTGRAVYDGTLEFDEDENFQKILDKYGIIEL